MKLSKWKYSILSICLMRYIASLSNSEKSSSCLFIFFSRMNEILYLPICRIILDTNLQTSVGKSEEYRAEQAIPHVLPTTAELLNILLSI